jgi:arsenate reductase
MALILYHNPQCSKSRQALTLLRDRGEEPEVVEYLKQPPSPGELRVILLKLGMTARALFRAGDKKALELDLPDPSELSDAQLIELMCTHPLLMQRPILVNDDRARLGRPPEAVLEIL